MIALGWGSIVRLGAVQAAIGAMVMLSTSLLNRVMVVEYALPAALPAALVAWHYAVQLGRPLWGHGSDLGRRRTPWILGGLAALALGTMLAASVAALIPQNPALGLPFAILAYTLIGAGVGAAGTSLLALLATHVAPARRPAAAAITWIMMVAGIVATAAVAGNLVDPFSPTRLLTVVGGVAGAAVLLAALAVHGVERETVTVAKSAPVDFAAAVRSVFADHDARRFTLFVFVAMLAYSMQDMILEPFAGLRFGMTPGESTKLAGAQHGGVLLGMIAAGVGGSAFSGKSGAGLRRWIVGGCLGSAVALVGLSFGSAVGSGWPLTLNAVLLGLANGVFAVAAIGAMMELAGAGKAGEAREGTRMGVWGAAQAIAFGTGGLLGATGVDVIRALTGDAPQAFAIVFAIEAALFVAAAAIAVRVAAPRVFRAEAMA